MGIELQVDMSVTMLLGEKLYTQDQGIVLLRETLQNSLDAGATIIKISTYDRASEGYTYAIEDNGEGIVDFQKYFLTLGGSHKTCVKSIGKYGIAKLAIIGMKDWSIDSVEGRITRETLLAGGEIASEYARQGCVIRAESPKRWYGMEQDIQRFLKLCEFPPDVRIWYNTEEILPYESRETLALGVEAVRDIGAPTAKMVIRNQGLVQYYDSIYVDDDFVPCYIYEVIPACDPYDDRYPFSANREALVGDELRRYQDIKQQIINSHRDHNRLIEATKAELFSHPSGFVRDSSATDVDVDAYLEQLQAWKKAVLFVLRAVEDDGAYSFGLSFRDSIVASYSPDSQCFLCNPGNLRFRKPNLYATAIHEVAHIAEQSHYESYAREQTKVTQKVLEELMLAELK